MLYFVILLFRKLRKRKRSKDYIFVLAVLSILQFTCKLYVLDKEVPFLLYIYMKSLSSLKLENIYQTSYYSAF